MYRRFINIALRYLNENTTVKVHPDEKILTSESQKHTMDQALIVHLQTIMPLNKAALSPLVLPITMIIKTKWFSEIL